MSEHLRKLLHDSLDRALSAEEQKILDQGLLKHPELREEQENLILLKSLSKDSRVDFADGFTDRVMKKISLAKMPDIGLQLFAEELWRSFRTVGFAAALLLIGFIAYNLQTSDSRSLATAFAMPQISMEQLLVPEVLMELE